MNNIFYLTPESFDDSRLSEEEFYRLVNDMLAQVEEINSHLGNTIVIVNKIYETFSWRGHTLDEIWDPTCELDRDIKFRLQSLLMNSSSTETDESPDFVNSDSGLLTLAIRNKYPVEYQVTNSQNSWYRFCLAKIDRQEMDKNEFLNDCVILFDNLVILDRNYDTIKAIYNDFKGRILHHLNGLNLFLRQAQANGGNRSETLKMLSDLGRFDEVASLEGNASRKNDFTFVIDGHAICCEPHIKLCKSDRKGDAKYYFHRIYFHEGDNKIRNGKTIIGHIGEHL